jgi:hypothetical protein
MRRFLTVPSLPRSNLEVFTGIYRSYKWALGQVAANIQSQLLTPMYPPLADPTAACQVSCSICYSFFPQVNETCCCAQHICTECIAATIDPPGGDQTCPFCRKPGFAVAANLQRWQLRRRDEDDKQYAKFQQVIHDGFDLETAKGCSDEAIAAALQFQTHPAEVQRLLDSGVRIDDVLQMLSRPRTAEPEVQAALQPPELPAPAVVVVSDSSDDGRDPIVK